MVKDTLKISIVISFLGALGLSSCNNEDNAKPDLRAKIDYNTLTVETPYPELFVDGSGQTTVDLSEGNNRHKMFQALNYYASSSISGNKKIEASKLKSLFSNSGNPFTDISTSTISVSGSALNESEVQLRNVTGASESATEAEAIRLKIESYFTDIETASNSVTTTASKGVAGKLGSYLVDVKGIETIQVIQKSLIGSLQLDYIGNVLLNKGLEADNYSLVNGKTYTKLEHNWDEAYGLLTLNPVYLKGATDLARVSAEFGLGAYAWEYNRTNYSKIYPAFLKGRAAIINNDKAEINAQAILLRTEFEKAIANAAIGYLDKWKTNTTNEASRAHAIGEGVGFIYSLRFATIHNADAKFSDDIINGLIGSANGFWDIDASKINAASDAIKAKFKLI